jgi:HSP20 family protein
MFGDLINFDSSLFGAFRRLEQEMDEFFGRQAWPAAIRSPMRGTYPPINVGATPDKVNVCLFAVGLDPKSLDISIQQNLLDVSGERKIPAGANVNHYPQERFNGNFRRVITLPEDVDPDRVEAHCRDGVLQITVHRREIARPRQIQVN